MIMKLERNINMLIIRNNQPIGMAKVNLGAFSILEMKNVTPQSELQNIPKCHYELRQVNTKED